MNEVLINSSLLLLAHGDLKGFLFPGVTGPFVPWCRQCYAGAECLNHPILILRSHGEVVEFGGTTFPYAFLDLVVAVNNVPIVNHYFIQHLAHLCHKNSLVPIALRNYVDHRLVAQSGKYDRVFFGSTQCKRSICVAGAKYLSLIHISEPTRQAEI